tara:strand:+ start:265 stop:585 length:321 start_codon:yes stop_codon:yes gene_type:complete
MSKTQLVEALDLFMSTFTVWQSDKQIDKNIVSIDSSNTTEDEIKQFMSKHKIDSHFTLMPPKGEYKNFSLFPKSNMLLSNFMKAASGNLQKNREYKQSVLAGDGGI